MSYMFNLADYEPVEVRLEKFIKDYPDFRISTELEVVEATRYIVKAYLYKTSEDSIAWATGYAEETVSTRGVNQTSALENCETSAIGRALANAGYAPKGKRPSREEMSKVAPNHPALQVVPNPVPVDVDYWNTSFKEQAIIAEVINIQSPSETCDHGAMDWKTGEKNGKQWGGFMCPVKSQTGGTPSCPARWYVISSSGKWEPQKARV
jgi:hypothetical protein